MSRSAVALALVGGLALAVPASLTYPAIAVEAVDPAAISILEAMSAKLSAAKTISVTASGQFDVPNADGQPIFYMTKSDVALQRPDKLRVSVLGDGPRSEFLWDGKTMTVFLPDNKVVASGEAPAVLEDMLDSAHEGPGISFPFADFLVADPMKSLTAGLNSAFVIGTSELVGDTTTNMVAIANDELEAQLWIGTDDKLPRLIWISPTGASEKSRRAIAFSDWKLDAPLAADVFKPSDVGDAKEVSFATPDAPAVEGATK